MPLPTVPIMVAPAAIDTPSTNGVCIYNAQPISAGWVSPNVLINKTPVSMIYANQLPDLISGQPLPTDPITYFIRIPICAVPVPRIVVANKNTSVYINKLKPAITGDTTTVAGAERPIVGPYQFPNVVIQAYSK